MITLSLSHVKKSFGESLILKDITLAVNKGEKVGIIGSNGTGKTTLFKIIAGLEKSDSGKIFISNEATIGYLEQIPEYKNEEIVIDILRNTFNEILTLKNKLIEVEKKLASSVGEIHKKLIKSYGDLISEFENKNGYNIEVKLDKIATGLKIDTQIKNMYFNSLSGGEKTRVMLAKLLLKNPEIILLDEPTNHLDMESLEWLENFLINYNGTVLVITHDRYFLNKVVESIVEIEDGKAYRYTGNYTDYSQKKEKKLIKQFNDYRNQQKKIKAMEEAIKRYRDWGKRSDNPKFFKKAFNLEKRLEKLELIEKPEAKKTIKLDFSTRNRSGNDVIQIRGLSKSFNGKEILKDLDFNLYFQEKVALLGKNGSGKSTLFKLINQEYKLDKGKIKIGARVNIGYQEQEVEFSNQNKTVVDLYKKLFNLNEGKARNILAGFLFFGDDVFKRIKNLSGGEKVRLKLCILMHTNTNLILLDEPTNHLDIDSMEVFETALLNYKGTIFFISHDRYLINKIAEKIVEIQNKKLKQYNGNYDYYKRRKIQDSNRGKITKIEKESKGKRKFIESRKKANLNKKNQRRLIQIEENIEEIENELILVKGQIEKYGRDYKKLKELTIEKQKKENKIEMLMQEWLKLDNQLKT